MDMVGMEMEGEDNHVRDALIPSRQLVVVGMDMTGKEMEVEDNHDRDAQIPSRHLGMDMAGMEIEGDDDHVWKADHDREHDHDGAHDHDGEHDHDREVYHMEGKKEALPVVANPQNPLLSQLLRPLSSFPHPLHQLDID